MGNQASRPPTTYLDPRLLSLPDGVARAPSPEFLARCAVEQEARAAAEAARTATAYEPREVR
jgi:hypothetical protein